MSGILRLLDPLISIFIPSSCIFCGQELPAPRRVVCHTCYKALPRLSSQLLKILQDEIEPRHFSRLFIPFEFSERIQNLIHLIKYRNFLTLGEYFAYSISQLIQNPVYNIITGVPLNPVRRRERGYNQSEVIAKHLAFMLDLPFDPHLLERDKNTVSQTNLNREERKANVRDAFICTRNLTGQTVLIVDDVITTGSTLNECAKICKNSGAAQVDLAAVATPANILQHRLERENLFSDIL